MWQSIFQVNGLIQNQIGQFFVFSATQYFVVNYSSLNPDFVYYNWETWYLTVIGGFVAEKILGPYLGPI